jgi:hypothetical protein
MVVTNVALTIVADGPRRASVFAPTPGAYSPGGPYRLQRGMLA